MVPLWTARHLDFPKTAPFTVHQPPPSKWVCDLVSESLRLGECVSVWVCVFCASCSSCQQLLTTCWLGPTHNRPLGRSQRLSVVCTNAHIHKHTACVHSCLFFLVMRVLRCSRKMFRRIPTLHSPHMQTELTFSGGENDRPQPCASWFVLWLRLSL